MDGEFYAEGVLKFLEKMRKKCRKSEFASYIIVDDEAGVYR